MLCSKRATTSWRRSSCSNSVIICVLGSLLDLALVQHFELIPVGRVHLAQQVERLLGLALVDLAHGEPNVDEHPVAQRDAVGAHQRDVDVALDAGDIHFRDMISIVYELYDLARNTKAHISSNPATNELWPETVNTLKRVV